MVRFPASARHTPLLHKLQTGCRAHPASYFLGTGWRGRLFLWGVKRQWRDADHLLVLTFRMAGAVYLPPRPHAFMACWGTALRITSIIIPEKRNICTCRHKFQAPLRTASNLRYSSVIYLEGMRKTADSLSEQPIFGLRFNPLNPELNSICYLLALLGFHHFLHVSRIRVKLLIFRLLMSYIYGAPILDVSRSHTTTQHSR